MDNAKISENLKKLREQVCSEAFENIVEIVCGLGYKKPKASEDAKLKEFKKTINGAKPGEIYQDGDGDLWAFYKHGSVMYCYSFSVLSDFLNIVLNPGEITHEGEPIEDIISYVEDCYEQYGHIKCFSPFTYLFNYAI